ncbi:MAG: zf-HC2 domain-containing protein [Acidobacteria bacterium]|nr:zf-HC2 domain-containing protein [Acidobacteriota bacterium]
MKENRNAADFAGGAAAPRGCERAEEFVTYLYGEATPDESRAFRLHLEACAVCREELVALGGVREAFGAWRAEALGSVPPLDLGEALRPAFVRPRAGERKRSASAALREFFALAPVWLRAGAFAATLAVCALTALTLARAEVTWNADGLAFRTGVTERVGGGQVPAHPAAVPTAPAPQGYTDEQVEAIVSRRIAEAEAQFRKQQASQVVNASVAPNKNQPAADAQPSRQRKRATRPGTRRDEPLLAGEDNLPRLTDLLDGSY